MTAITIDSSTNSYFFPKNDIILPCPDFPPAFLPFAVDDNAGVLSLVGTGSSSENDSQAGSSFVTRCEAKASQDSVVVSILEGWRGYRPR